MFHRHNDAVYMDLSLDLRDHDDWQAGVLRTMDYPLNITALAVEPISGLLAIGTAGGVAYVFGGPGVETKLTLPDTVGVRFLHFAQSTFQLVCLDDGNMLHIWNLATYGRPRLVKSVRFDQTNSLTLSPCHSHAFLGLNSGEIKTYDLTCLRKSPYTMPNMWTLHQDKLLARGAPCTPSVESRRAVETVIHPRDLNRLFVAYGGGVVLTDLTERITSHVYELVLPPGAPGGFGYGSRELLTHRRPDVTALAVHPAGHFFVVGHSDGSLSFWAVEDEEKPLLVRTLDDLDVNVVDSARLDEHISKVKSGESMAPSQREPIFKLAWSGFSNSSDPRGGKTTLAILGGLNAGEAAGLTVIQLPAFNPPEPPASAAASPQQPSLHPDMRQAMRDSLDPAESYFYFTRGVVQDFLLVPQKSPHFAGTFDPMGILLLTEAEADTRTLEAYQYPPPEFALTDAKGAASASKSEAHKDALESLADDLADALHSLQSNDEPQRLILPAALSNGSSGLLNGRLLKLERETGQAWSEETKMNDIKLAKFQPHRILITQHRDQTVNFHDISAQLLIGIPPTPIQHSFPSLLPDLKIDLQPVLMDAVVAERTSPTLIDHARIDSVYFATEALEATVVLQSGEVIIYRLSGPRPATARRDSSDPELILLGHVPSRRGFSPYFLFGPGRGHSEACAISDLGFLAVAYHNALYVVNMRGPEVMLRHVDEKPAKGKHVAGLIPGHAESDPVTSLVWTISRLAKDPEARVRLVAMRASGHYQVYTLTQTGSSTQRWACEKPITVDGGVPHPLPRCAFVIDSKTGVGLPASPSRLAAADGPQTPSILVMVGAKGARCFANVNGERIGKVEWGSKVGIIQGVQIVEKLGSHVLVVTTNRNDALVYSLPHLEHLLTLKLPPVSWSSLSLDESGDFIAWTPHPSAGTIHQATYGTLFDIRRAYDLPDIDLACTKPVIPAPPQPVSAGPASMLNLGSWLPFNQSTSGSQIDELLGGPDRPIPVPEQQPRNSEGGPDIAGSVAGVTAAAAATQASLYNRLTSALSERGQVLSELEERFNALEQGSRSMAAQAKRLATEQTAKSWFGL
ncbi:putative lethal giant larvae(Lgl) like, C-terminal [Lyophyllum shimeji]|uniref:Lethal giant larvae(Lgl) like, C-terminal n=1 Tax=Lyophyllum shimeji TaxID=47721 RepID=A0A9P3PH24_LYOSH|nr:putative lethal giant larvae(Lgl) like, C-terminal [Lyophyllum shimeji]